MDRWENAEEGEHLLIQDRKKGKYIYRNGSSIGRTPKSLNDVVIFLKKHQDEVFTPTQIGEALGQPYYMASAWAGGLLRRLMSEGWVEKTGRGAYTYRKRENRGK